MKQALSSLHAQRVIVRNLFRALILVLACLGLPPPALAGYLAPNAQADTNENENHVPTRPEPTQAARRIGDVPAPEEDGGARRRRARVAYRTGEVRPPSVIGLHVPRPHKTLFALLI